MCKYVSLLCTSIVYALHATIMNTLTPCNIKRYYYNMCAKFTTCIVVFSVCTYTLVTL